MSDPGTQQESGTVYYVLCKTKYACHDLDEFIHCWRQLHDAEEMYIDQCISELAYRSMDGKQSSPSTSMPDPVNHPPQYTCRHCQTDGNCASSSSHS